MIAARFHALRQIVRRLFVDRRGGGDLTTYMLLTAAGAAMVGLTVPSLFHSSQTAARTFDNQVSVLERGSNPSGGATGGTFDISIGAGGVQASGGGISVGVDSKGSVSGSASVGGAGSALVSSSSSSSKSDASLLDRLKFW